MFPWKVGIGVCWFVPDALSHGWQNCGNMGRNVRAEGKRTHQVIHHYTYIIIQGLVLHGSLFATGRWAWPTSMPITWLSWKMRGQIAFLWVSSLLSLALPSLILTFFSVNQIETHPFLAWNECVTYCQRENIAIMAYSPLAKAEKMKDPTLCKIARQWDCANWMIITHDIQFSLPGTLNLQHRSWLNGAYKMTSFASQNPRGRNGLLRISIYSTSECPKGTCKRWLVAVTINLHVNDSNFFSSLNRAT